MKRLFVILFNKCGFLSVTCSRSSNHWPPSFTTKPRICSSSFAVVLNWFVHSGISCCGCDCFHSELPYEFWWHRRSGFWRLTCSCYFQIHQLCSPSLYHLKAISRSFNLNFSLAWFAASVAINVWCSDSQLFFRPKLIRSAQPLSFHKWVEQPNHQSSRSRLEST